MCCSLTKPCWSNLSSMGLIQHISSAYGACCIILLTFHLELTFLLFIIFIYICWIIGGCCKSHLLSLWVSSCIVMWLSCIALPFTKFRFHAVKMSRKYMKHNVLFCLFLFLHIYNSLNTKKWVMPHQLLPVTSVISDSYSTCFKNIVSISLEVTAKYFKHHGRILHRSNQYCLVGCHNVKSCMPWFVCLQPSKTSFLFSSNMP